MYMITDRRCPQKKRPRHKDGASLQCRRANQPAPGQRRLGLAPAPRRPIGWACQADGRPVAAAIVSAPPPRPLAIKPDFSTAFIDRVIRIRNPDDRAHYLEGLRKAGLPE